MKHYSIKKDFKIFQNNPDLIYLDSTATSQKPEYVTDGMKQYLEHDYGNIHRGFHILAERSEKLYIESKKKIASFIGADSWREVIYSFNSTYALNLLLVSLRRSGYFCKGDKVLLSIVEHHANIVPWLILKEEFGLEIEYIGINDDYSLDFNDLEKRLDERVKAVSLTHVSNVTGEVFDIQRVGELVKQKKDDTLLIVDASQSVPHFAFDVKKLGCDFIFFTGHKLMADSGIGVLWGKGAILKDLKPGISGGGAIDSVREQEFQSSSLPDKFEPGTPNLSGAVSLLRAFEYIESIGGYQRIEEIEDGLVGYTLSKFIELKGIRLIGSQNPENRVGVFSFIVEGLHSHDVAEYMAQYGICIRAGQHCAEPFLTSMGVNHTCRMSLYIYNDKKDIDGFFRVLQQCILELT